MTKINAIGLFGLISLAISIITLSSCSKPKEASKPMFTAEDTSIVLNMTQEWLEMIHNKDFDSATSMLYDLKSGGLDKIDSIQAAMIKEQFTTFPILKYKLENMTFRNPYDVKLVYSFEFFEKEEGSSIPNTMNISFAPERRNDKWFLAIEKKSVQ